MFKLFKSRPGSSSVPARRSSTSSAASRTDGSTRRSPETVADQQLSSLAISWLRALPEGERPAALCARFARIANRLALVWPDAELTDRYFESLIIDRRGGRKGFPPDVMVELLQLRALRLQDQRAAPARPALEMRAIDFELSR